MFFQIAREIILLLINIIYTKKLCNLILVVFLFFELFLSHCIIISVAKENLLKTPAIFVTPKNS